MYHLQPITSYDRGGGSGGGSQGRDQPKSACQNWIASSDRIHRRLRHARTISESASIVFQSDANTGLPAEIRFNADYGVPEPFLKRPVSFYNRMPDSGRFWLDEQTTRGRVRARTETVLVIIQPELYRLLEPL